MCVYVYMEMTTRGGWGRETSTLCKCVPAFSPFLSLSDFSSSPIQWDFLPLSMGSRVLYIRTSSVRESSFRRFTYGTRMLFSMSTKTPPPVPLGYGASRSSPASTVHGRLFHMRHFFRKGPTVSKALFFHVEKEPLPL